MGGRLDTWVLRVGIAIPLLCIAVLVLWHLIAYLAGKLVKKPKSLRHSPEPQASVKGSSRLRGEQVLAGQAGAVAQPVAPAGSEALHLESVRHVKELLSCLERGKALAATLPDLPVGAEAKQFAAQIKNDVERLQEACATLLHSLAEDAWDKDTSCTA
ncbi:MAG TPA: hypothetical protein VGY58_19860 [Gemmataceae bacterium]|nr:hypothetical protein [Gemmataceae bacterium]